MKMFWGAFPGFLSSWQLGDLKTNPVCSGAESHSHGGNREHVTWKHREQWEQSVKRCDSVIFWCTLTSSGRNEENCLTFRVNMSQRWFHPIGAIGNLSTRGVEISIVNKIIDIFNITCSLLSVKTLKLNEVQTPTHNRGTWKMALSTSFISPSSSRRL